MNYSHFEWFYFDFHSTDGYDVVCTIHPKPFNSIFDICIFDVFIYKNNKPLFHHFFVINRNLIQRNEGEYVLRYNQHNYIRKSGDHIEVEIKDNAIHVQLSLKDILKITRPMINELVDKKNDESRFNWIVYAPYCEGTAIINWQGNSLRLTGKGYHDYNSGSANLKQDVKKWYWGKYYFADELLVYGEIIARNGKKRNIALWINKNGCHMDDNPVMVENNQEIEFNVASKKIILKMQPRETIDDVSFYMSKLSGLTLFVKVIEALYHLSAQHSLTFINTLLANTRYLRSRTVGQTSANEAVSCFYEEMFF